MCNYIEKIEEKLIAFFFRRNKMSRISQIFVSIFFILLMKVVGSLRFPSQALAKSFFKLRETTGWIYFEFLYNFRPNKDKKSIQDLVFDTNVPEYARRELLALNTRALESEKSVLRLQLGNALRIITGKSTRDILGMAFCDLIIL